MVGNKNLDVAALGRCSHFGLLARHTAPLAICTTGTAVRLLAFENTGGINPDLAVRSVRRKRSPAGGYLP
jgi:hypothetical protein